MIRLQYRDSLSHLEMDNRDYAIRKIQSLIGENISGEEELRTFFHSLFRILRQIFQVSFRTLCMVYSIALCSSNMLSKFLKKRFFSLENKDTRESTEFSSYRKRNKGRSQRRSLRNRRTLAPVNTPKMRHVYGRGETLVQLVAACCCATSPLSRRSRQKNTVIRRERMKIGLR